MSELTVNQALCLYIYSLYSSEKNIIYLQYTGMLAVSYHLLQKKIFDASYGNDTLIYDYLDTRRYVWEDKQFMRDINILRDRDFLTRARIRTLAYRDYNAHQITEKGRDHLESCGFMNRPEALAAREALSCPRCGRLMEIVLEASAPRLVCRHGKKYTLTINGFLRDGSTGTGQALNPYYL